MGWLSWLNPKPRHDKQVKAAVKVASNLYYLTIPGAADAVAPLQFSLPDSRYRYLMFCLSATQTACAGELSNSDAVFRDCLRFLTMAATGELITEFFAVATDAETAANSGAAFTRQFLNHWSRYEALETEGGKNLQINDLLCSMIHIAESDGSLEETDKKRLAPLAVYIYCLLPTMRSAFQGLVNG